MAKHLTDIDVQRVVSIIDGWSNEEKFTWEKLCDISLARFNLDTTRQTLQKFLRIKDAYEQKKNALRKNGKANVAPVPSLKIAAKRIAVLEAENARLKREQEQLLAQFMIWQYNAYSRGVTMEQLSRPLPKKHTRTNTDE